MPDKSGSNRIGFNRRGPGISEQIENARHQSEISNPDSYYWRSRAIHARDNLALCMGVKEFEEWVERLYPGDVIDSVPWKEIHEAYSQKFQRVQAEIAMADSHDWEDDPNHLKTNGEY